MPAAHGTLREPCATISCRTSLDTHALQLPSAVSESELPKLARMLVESGPRSKRRRFGPNWRRKRCRFGPTPVRSVVVV